MEFISDKEISENNFLYQQRGAMGIVQNFEKTLYSIPYSGLNHLPLVHYLSKTLPHPSWIKNHILLQMGFFPNLPSMTSLGLL